jgi:hypothetical protein
VSAKLRAIFLAHYREEVDRRKICTTATHYDRKEQSDKGMTWAFTRFIDCSILNCCAHVIWSAVKLETAVPAEHVTATAFEVVFIHIELGKGGIKLSIAWWGVE